MKLLTATKVQRLDSGAPEVKEWESAAQQATHDGQVAFKARQMARMKAAQAKASDNVKPIQRKAKA